MIFSLVRHTTQTQIYEVKTELESVKLVGMEVGGVEGYEWGGINKWRKVKKALNETEGDDWTNERKKKMLNTWEKERTKQKYLNETNIKKGVLNKRQVKQLKENDKRSIRWGNVSMILSQVFISLDQMSLTWRKMCQSQSKYIANIIVFLLWEVQETSS